MNTNPRSGILNDPNDPDDERYVLRLIAKVVAVSLETVKIVNPLPEEAWSRIYALLRPNKQLSSSRS